MPTFFFAEDQARYNRVFGEQPDERGCSDCGAHNPRRSVPGKRFCDDCYTWRSQRGVVFDERTRPEIEQALLDEVIDRR